MSPWWEKDPLQLELGAAWEVWQREARRVLEGQPTWEEYAERVAVPWEVYQEELARIAAKYARD